MNTRQCWGSMFSHNSSFACSLISEHNQHQAVLGQHVLPQFFLRCSLISEHNQHQAVLGQHVLPQFFLRCSLISEHNQHQAVLGQHVLPQFFLRCSLSLPDDWEHSPPGPEDT
ncbi:hypothetical protein BgiBS90_028594 [Biomphalaria glabrata]|nr:hypothetical protein BgiBS90_028594 [Biomphalaria glabrata]